VNVLRLPLARQKLPVISQSIFRRIVTGPSGDTAFTVPLFDEFMRRILPGDAWRERE
jgi:hypothetical protein